MRTDLKCNASTSGPRSSTTTALRSGRETDESTSLQESRHEISHGEQKVDGARKWLGAVPVGKKAPPLYSRGRGRGGGRRVAASLARVQKSSPAQHNGLRTVSLLVVIMNREKTRYVAYAIRVVFVWPYVI